MTKNGFPAVSAWIASASASAPADAASSRTAFKRQRLHGEPLDCARRREHAEQHAKWMLGPISSSRKVATTSAAVRSTAARADGERRARPRPPSGRPRRRRPRPPQLVEQSRRDGACVLPSLDRLGRGSSEVRRDLGDRAERRRRREALARTPGDTRPARSQNARTSDACRRRPSPPTKTRRPPASSGGVELLEQVLPFEQLAHVPILRRAAAPFALYRVCGKPRSTFDVAGSGQRDVTTLPRV